MKSSKTAEKMATSQKKFRENIIARGRRYIKSFSYLYIINQISNVVFSGLTGLHN